jgi:hypothetical protein
VFQSVFWEIIASSCPVVVRRPVAILMALSVAVMRWPKKVSVREVLGPVRRPFPIPMHPTPTNNVVTTVC